MTIETSSNSAVARGGNAVFLERAVGFAQLVVGIDAHGANDERDRAKQRGGPRRVVGEFAAVSVGVFVGIGAKGAYLGS